MDLGQSKRGSDHYLHMMFRRDHFSRRGRDWEIKLALLKRIFLIGRLDRASPRSIKFCQHLFRWSPARIDDSIERLEMPRLVPPGRVDASAATQARMRKRQAFLGDLEQIAISDFGLEAE